MARNRATVDENDLSISPAKCGILHHGLSSTKPLVSSQNEKVENFDDDSKKSNDAKPTLCSGRKKGKITDFFPQRRSQRKTRQALNAEKHQKLIKAILDGTQDGLKAIQISGKGRGVISCKSFYKNDFVVEYAGDLLTVAEAKTREKKYSKDNRMGCYMYYFQHNGQQYCVDATKETDRLGRLINHSRTGNLITKVVQVKSLPRLILVAKRDIEVDEELTYDYGDRSREALRHHPWLAH